MPVSRAQAKEICTKPEYELVEASFRPAVTELTPARLRSKIERARKLQDKYRDLSRQQNRGTKETERSRQASNLRTERKSRLFEETRERFEKRLAQLEAKGEADAGGTGTRRATSRRAGSEKRKERRQTKRELRRKAAR
jgi:hypothetical protein